MSILYWICKGHYAEVGAASEVVMEGRIKNNSLRTYLTDLEPGILRDLLQTRLFVEVPCCMKCKIEEDKLLRSDRRIRLLTPFIAIIGVIVLAYVMSYLDRFMSQTLKNIVDWSFLILFFLSPVIITNVRYRKFRRTYGERMDTLHGYDYPAISLLQAEGFALGRESEGHMLYRKMDYVNSYKYALKDKVYAALYNYSL